MFRPTLRSCFIAVVVAIVAVHLIAVTLAALPPNRFSDAARDQTGYLDPYFNQNWRLFAPNPISEDRNLLFQGAYIDADGRMARTSWVDWTDVELDLVRHQLIGGRAGYVTNKLVSPLRSRMSALDVSQQLVVTSASQTAPPTWTELSRELEGAGTPRTRLLGFLRYERAATQLGTDVLQARFPDVDLTAVRYSVRRQSVVPFDARAGTAKERAARRPTAVEDIGGWRRPTPGSSAERSAVQDFDRRHR